LPLDMNGCRDGDAQSGEIIRTVGNGRWRPRDGTSP